MEELGEFQEHKVIRTNLANITQLVSSDPSAGPTWFAQKLEEKAFIASAAGAVVPGCSTYQQTSALMGAVVNKIQASQEPKKEFAKFIDILRSNPPLESLATKLVEECATVQQVVGSDEPCNGGGDSPLEESHGTRENGQGVEGRLQVICKESDQDQGMSTLESHDGSIRNLLPSLEQQPNVSPEALPALMHTENSGGNELQVIQKELEKLEYKFGNLVLDAQEVFSKKERKSVAFLPKLRNSLTLLPSSKKRKYLRFLKESRKEIRKATSVEDFFYVLNFYWNCFNYSLLEYLIGKFGNEALETKLSRYLADLQKFEKSTKVKDFVNTCRFNYKLPPSSEIIAVKMKAMWADCTLDHVRDLCQKLIEAACLEEFTLFFSGGAISSIILMWAVPSSVVHLLAKAMDEGFLKKHKIEGVTIDGKGLHDYLLEKRLQQPKVKECPDPQELIVACENDNLCDILDLLDAGVPVNTREDSFLGRTPLHFASEGGHHDTVRVLLEHHADVNACDKSGRTALHWASWGGHHDTVWVLLEHHADVNARDRWEKIPLYYASWGGHHDTIQVLLEHHADVNARDGLEKTTLHFASWGGHHNTVRVLLEHHADVNARDRFEQTPLHYACERGHHDTVWVLLEHHADVNVCDEWEKTPLHYASEGGYHDTIRVLLEHHADVNARGEWEKTPLHYASEEGYHDTIRVLLEHHADVNACDGHGQTAMDLARGYPEVIKELEKYVPGASSRLTTMKDPKPKYMTTSSEHSVVEKFKHVPRPRSSSELQHHWPVHSPTSSEHSKAKSKSSEEGTEYKTD